MYNVKKGDIQYRQMHGMIKPCLITWWIITAKEIGHIGMVHFWWHLCGEVLWLWGTVQISNCKGKRILQQIKPLFSYRRGYQKVCRLLSYFKTSSGILKNILFDYIRNSYMPTFQNLHWGFQIKMHLFQFWNNYQCFCQQS